MEKPIKIFVIVEILIILIIGGFFAWQYFGASKQLIIDQIESAEVYSDGFKEKVILINGSYERKYSEGVNALYVNIDEKNIVFGDLDNDGSKEAIFIANWSGGGSGTWKYLTVLKNKDGQPSFVASKDLGDRTIVNSITVNSGKITVDIIVHALDDPMCCPTQEETANYRLSNNQLELIDVLFGWRTYRNYNYGFEIKYPFHIDTSVKDWASETSNMLLLLNFGGNLNISDSIVSIFIEKGTSIDDLKTEVGREDLFNNLIVNPEYIKDVNIGIANYPAKKIDYKNETLGIDLFQYLIEHSGLLYQIMYARGSKIITESDFNQMISTFEFLGGQEIQTGKINIDNNQITELQKAVDAGSQPWRLDIDMVALADLPQYGFTQDDLKTLQCPHVASNWVVGKDITGLWCEVSHDNQKYLVLVSQPQAGIGKIWMVLEIEKPPLNK